MEGINNTVQLTQETLKKYLKYDKESGVFTWAVSRGGKVVGDIAGSIEKGYIRIRLEGVNYAAHRLAWLYETGTWPFDEIDHIDRVRDNNRFANLRDATDRDNANNRSTNREVIGAYPRPNGRWSSCIRYKGEQVHLGQFKTEDEASNAYKSAEMDIKLGNYPVPTGLRKQGKGYYFETSTAKWRANPTLRGKQTSLGRYSTEQEAIDAVAKARAEVLKEEELALCLSV
jgi:hypothetical protein